MFNQPLYRNIRAKEQFDIFLLSAVGSVLIIRLYLELTNYPQIGGGGLHIAHMLWGGLLMAAGSIIMFAFLGLRAQRLAALVSGIGFGFFIDEIGKFITSDNNYFFEPAVGIIYATFVILYLIFNFLSRSTTLSNREYQLNAIAHLEEAVLHDMDPVEKQRARDLLAKADQNSLITRQLKKLIDDVKLVPENEPNAISRFLAFLDREYTAFWNARSSRRLVQAFFILETILFLIVFSFGIFNNLDDFNQFISGTASYETWLYGGQIASSLVAAGFAVVGAVLLPKSRLLAFEQFRRATLINLLLTEFFIFSLVEFQALPGFIFNLAVLGFITYTMHQERRTQRAERALEAKEAKS